MAVFREGLHENSAFGGLAQTKYIFSILPDWRDPGVQDEDGFVQDRIFAWLQERGPNDDRAVAARHYNGLSLYWYNGVYLLTNDDNLALEFKLRWC